MRKQVMISASNFKYIQITHTHSFTVLQFCHSSIMEVARTKTKGHCIFDFSLCPLSYKCPEGSALIVSYCFLMLVAYNLWLMISCSVSFEMALFLDARSGSLNFFRQRLRHERVRRCTCRRRRRQLSQDESAEVPICSHWLTPREWLLYLLCTQGSIDFIFESNVHRTGDLLKDSHMCSSNLILLNTDAVNL